MTQPTPTPVIRPLLDRLSEIDRLLNQARGEVIHIKVQLNQLGIESPEITQVRAALDSINDKLLQASRGLS